MSKSLVGIDPESLQTAFARHKLGDSVQPLWEDQRIAVHWENSSSADPDDYEGRAATEVGKLNNIAEDGAIVGASYRDVYKNKMLVGLVAPESKIDILFVQDGDIVASRSINPGESIEYPTEIQEGCSIYKSVEMEECVTVTREEQPLLFDDGVRPPFWSVCEWEGAEDQLRAVWQGELPPYEVGSLTTDQLELVCEEFLRIVDDSYCRTSDIGGTMSDVDIIGASGDELVWAQVTQGGEAKVQDKIGKLGDYTEEDARVIIFAPASSRPEEIDPDITFIPVEGVFEAVNLNESGSLLLSRLLGRIK